MQVVTQRFVMRVMPVCVFHELPVTLCSTQTDDSLPVIAIIPCIALKRAFHAVDSAINSLYVLLKLHPHSRPSLLFLHS